MFSVLQETMSLIPSLMRSRMNTLQIQLSTLRAVALLLAVALPLTVFAESAATYYEKAQQHATQKEYQAALIELKNALKEDPDHLPSLVLMGQSLVHTGDIVTAEKYLQAAIKRGANDEQIITTLGSIYLAQEKYEQLLSTITSGGRSTDVEMQILVLRGYAYLYLGQYEQAEDSFKRAERLLPGEPAPVFGLATLEIRRGSLDAAEKLIARSEELGLDDADIWYAKAEVHRRRGDYDLALGDLDQCLAKNPQYNSARISRAALLIDKGDKEQALREIDTVLEDAPNNLEAVYLKGMLLMREGKQKEAAAELSRVSNALSVVPPDAIAKHASAQLMLGTLEYLKGHLGKAVYLLQRYIERDPHHLSARLILAEALMKQGDSVGAILVLKPMLKEHPAHADLLMLLGKAYLEDKRYQLASQYLERAASISPNTVSVHTYLAQSKLAEGDKDAAIKALKTAFDLAPDKTRTGLALATLQLQTKRYPEALETTSRIKKGAPQNPAVNNLAAEAHLGMGEIEAAREEIKEALRLDQEYYPALIQMARIEISEKHFDAAEARYSSLLRKRPSDILVMSDLAKSEVLQGHAKEAISWLEKIRNIQSDADISPQLLELAKLYLQTGQPEQVLDVTRELAKLLPADNRGIELEGRAYLMMDNKREASLAFRRILMYSPESPALLNRLAELLLEAGDIENAGEAVDKALEKDPGYLPARETRIRVALRNGHTELAKTLAQQLQKDHPEAPTGFRLMGDILMQNRQFAAAAQAYASALSIQPGTPLLLSRFRAERAAGNNHAAEQLLFDWLKSHPRDAPVTALLATLQSRSGNLEKARDLYETLTSLEADNFQVFNNLAGIYQKLGDPRALETARRAYDLAPEEPAANDTLGWILVQQGNYGEGLNYLREARARTSQHPVVSYHLAVALNGLARTAEAQRELKAALATGKPFAEEVQARALLDKLDNP